MAGYFQTVMYAFLALGLFAIAELLPSLRRWLRSAAVVASMLLIAVIGAAIQIVPTLELTLYSFRGYSNFSHTKDGLLQFRALASLFAPNWLGAISGNYTGPFDRTQYYFYAGLLLVPLAVIGVATSKLRRHALCLVIPSAWFMFGPQAGLHRLVMFLPGMNKVREPIQGWFIVALGLAMLAAGGFDWILRRWPARFLVVSVLALFFADLWYWNCYVNPLAYEHVPFETVYGSQEDTLRTAIASHVPPLTRYNGAKTRVGPLDDTLNLRLESTSGYAALPILPYQIYLYLMQKNTSLQDGLNIGAYVTGNPPVALNPSVLPRVYFPKSILYFPKLIVVNARDRAELSAMMLTLNQHEASVVRSARAHPPGPRSIRRHYQL